MSWKEGIRKKIKNTPPYEEDDEKTRLLEERVSRDTGYFRGQEFGRPNPEAVRLDKVLNKILGDLNGLLDEEFVGTEVHDAFNKLSKELFDPSNRKNP
tara:strand:- start:530 stop:823 length:294 start_codon:yes stop_codon:yes gene_type:complete